MPELGPFGGFFKKIHEKQKSEYPDSSEGFQKNREEFDKAVEDAGLEPVGLGAENVVIPYKEKVAALARYSEEADGLTPEGRKARFYTQKILHTLFPQHFPNFHAVFHESLSENHMGPGTVRERIQVEAGHEVGFDPEEEKLSQDAQILYDKLKELESYDLSIHEYLDLWGWNFHRVKGEVVYLDQLDGSFVKTQKDIKNLLRYMQDKKYPEDQVTRVRNWAQRALELEEA